MKLYKASFFLMLVLFFSRVVGIAQNISGVIVRMDNGKSIPFVSISIEGTTLGTVSDFEGVFDLEVLSEYENGQLIISCVGFIDKKVGIKNVFEKDNIIIKLEASSVDIDEVVVEQKSLQPYTIIKKAISSVKNNYLNVPYNYKLYYSNIDKTKNKQDIKREAIVLMYDEMAYKQASVYKTFKSINYMFLHSKRNFEVKYLNDGNTNIDNLLEFDIVRHRCNILDVSRVYDYEIAIKDEIVYKGDSVWVLSYSSKKPNFVSTGDFSANFYSGEIFVKKSDYAILYNKTTVKNGNLSKISRNIYVNPAKIKEPATYNFEVYYKQKDKHYVLDKIYYKLNFVNISRESSLQVLEVFVEKPHVVASRDYYEDLEFDRVFWNSFRY